jgi:putative proteasome-type protease
VYEVDRFKTEQIVCVDEQNPYFQMIRGTWGQRLRQVFESIEDPQWGDGATNVPLCVISPRYEPMKKITHPGEKLV